VKKTTMLVEGAVVAPAWQKILETQDPQDQFFKVVDGQTVITVYGADLTAKGITLTQESIQSIPTTDSLHPNILAAKDADGNTYLFNKDRGAWFTFFRGLAPSLERFAPVDRSDIPIIIAYLHTQTSLLSPDAKPVELSPIMTEPNVSKHAAFGCNYDEVNCSPAASIEYTDMFNGTVLDIKALILEVKTENPNDGRGYIANLTYVGDIYVSSSYLDVLPNPKKPYDFSLGVYEIGHPTWCPYLSSLSQQEPGLLDAMDTLQKTGVWTPEAEHMIWP
jgi:hypothetical protein